MLHLGAVFICSTVPPLGAFFCTLPAKYTTNTAKVNGWAWVLAGTWAWKGFCKYRFLTHLVLTSRSIVYSHSRKRRGGGRKIKNHRKISGKCGRAHKRLIWLVWCGRAWWTGAGNGQQPLPAVARILNDRARVAIPVPINERSIAYVRNYFLVSCIQNLCQLTNERGTAPYIIIAQHLAQDMQRTTAATPIQYAASIMPYSVLYGRNN